jgi:ElaB/YqjD/DUF883 family membrane-anchored ribosome-binding protein
LKFFPDPSFKFERGFFMAKTSHIRELQDTTHALREDVQKLGKISREVAYDTLGHLRENAAGYYKEGMEKARSMEQDLEGQIQQHPLRAVLIAAGVGAFLGLLMKRK